jgi:hypothetical protein
VHIFQATVVDFMQKKKMGKEKLNILSLEEADPYIRSHKRGWIFARHDLKHLEYHNAIKTNALYAVKALGLDFGAVDIIFNNFHGVSYVLEVNTAPGCSYTTRKNYAACFEAYKTAVEETL